MLILPPILRQRLVIYQVVAALVAPQLREALVLVPPPTRGQFLVLHQVAVALVAPRLREASALDPRHLLLLHPPLVQL